MIIYLVGFMGCGKSTVGRKLANDMGVDFVDLDTAIADEMGMTIGDIFTRYGEAEFRRIESRLLGEIDTIQDTVVATGGGAACFGNNMEVMNGRGVTVYLRLTDTGLFKRLKRGKARRPKIAGMSDDELIEYISRLMGERERFYSMATATVDCDGLDSDEVMAEVRAVVEGE